MRDIKRDKECSGQAAKSFKAVTTSRGWEAE